jgi:hypothetical protein
MSDYSPQKQALLDDMLSGRQELEAALARVKDSEMDLTILHGEWTVKDLLGHLAFWEETVTGLFITLRAGKNPEPFPDLDALNAQQIAEWRKIPLAEVKTREKAAFEQVVSLVISARDAELFEATHFPWTEGRVFAEFFCDNTCGHFKEHLPELIIWLKRIA